MREFESLIDELYAYGVTCDYLIGRGVTKDRVIGTFAEKGYKLPQHHLDKYREQQQQWEDHRMALMRQQQPVASTSTTYPSQSSQYPNGLGQNTLLAGKRAVSPVVTDYSSTLPGTSTSMSAASKSHHRATPSLTDPSLIRLGSLVPTPPASAPLPTTKRRRESQDHIQTQLQHARLQTPPASLQPSHTTNDPSAELRRLKEELARKEAAAKEALKARRAALAKQNAQRAESFIEGLLSESKASIQPFQDAGSSSMPSLPLPAESVRKSSPIGSTLKANSADADELEDYEDDDPSPAPAPAPKLPSPASSTSLSQPLARPDVHRRVSSTTFPNQMTRQHRAVATDFEADPSHKLSGVPRWTEQLLESSRRDMAYKDMLIDLSDSEDDEVGDNASDDEVDGQERKEDIDKSTNEKEQLRLAVKNSRLQDSLNHNNYYQVSSFSSSSSTPYPSYSLNNTKSSSESIRSSPFPSISTTSTSQIMRKKPSPPSSIHSRASTPSFPCKPINTPPATAESINTPSTAAGNAELEAKQAEIRKMLEMIKKLEGKKKQKKTSATTTTTLASGNSRSTASTTSSAQKNDSMSEHATAVSYIEAQHQEKIDAAKETVGRLLDEQEKLVSSSRRLSDSGNGKVGPAVASADHTLPGNPASSSASPSSFSITTANLMKREGSSDEAMSISSEDG